MSEEKITIAVVKDIDESPVFMEISNDDAGFEMVTTLISETSNTSIIDVSQFIRNTILMIDNDMSINPGGYNFSLQIYPLFGTVAFFHLGLVKRDGEEISAVVDMPKDVQEQVKEFIINQKKMELENGTKEIVEKEVNLKGKDNFIRFINDAFMEDSGEEAYKEAKKKQSEEENENQS